MSILTIVLLVLAVVSLCIGGFLKWLEKQQEPKEGEVQAQFFVTGSCLFTIFVILGIFFLFSSVFSWLFGG